MDDSTVEKAVFTPNSNDRGQLELLQKLLDDPEWRKQFLENPQGALAVMGMDASLLDILQLEKNPELDSQPLGERQSKSAWFGGNPFG